MTNNMSSNVQTPEIRCEIKGHTGYISLNRPKALNALSLHLFLDDVVAEVDAFIANEHRRARNEFPHFMLAFAAKRTIKELVARRFLGHKTSGCSVTCTRSGQCSALQRCAQHAKANERLQTGPWKTEPRQLALWRWLHTRRKHTIYHAEFARLVSS